MRAKKQVRIGVVGKYFDSGIQSYGFVYFCFGSLETRGIFWKREPVIEWIGSETFEKNPAALKSLSKYDGIVIPGGFGSRGVEGKIAAIKYCREHKIPYFGLCYGMQLAVIEFARHVAGLKKANTTEIDPKTPNPVIDIMPEQKRSMREKN